MAASGTRFPQEKAKDGFVEIEGSVVTGFEESAEVEAAEKFKTAARRGRGNVTWDVPLNDVKKVLKMGSIDNVRAVIHRVSHMGFTENETESMIKLRQLVVDIDWSWLVEVWRKFFDFSHEIRTSSTLQKEALCEVVLSSEIKKPENKPKEKQKNKGKQSKQQPKECEEPKVEMEEGAAAAKEEVDATQTSAPEGDAEREEAADDAVDSAGDAGECENLPEEGNPKEKASSIDVESAEKPCTEDGTTGSSTELPQCLAAEDGNANASATTTVEEPLEESPQGEITQAAKKAKVQNVPSFRVTCNRSGQHHSFDSMGAAANFGGAIQEYLNWNVNLKKFDIEVVVNIEDQKVMICVGLTRESLHRRLLTSFGPTTLRPTIAYNMLRLCHINPGDVVVDPLCGSGSIPIQGAVSWRRAYFFGGEINEVGLKKTAENVTNLNRKWQKENKKPIVMDAIRWDACHLPLKTSSIDVIISDLPFGKRMGNKVDNRTLYPRIVLEMARVVRPSTGRICLLTQDRKCLTKVLQTLGKYWSRSYINGVNIGGLSAAVYKMTRTDAPYNPSVHPAATILQGGARGSREGWGQGRGRAPRGNWRRAPDREGLQGSQAPSASDPASETDAQAHVKDADNSQQELSPQRGADSLKCQREEVNDKDLSEN